MGELEIFDKKIEGMMKVLGIYRTFETETQKRDIVFMKYTVSMLENINGVLSSIEKSFMGWSSWGQITDGLIDKEREHVQEIRKAIYETQGVTKESRALQVAYESIGKTVAETGMDRTDFQNSYKKALRSGIRDQKTAMSLTTSQLNAENQLGLKAGELQDTFQDWNMSGRMTIGQVAEMGRGLRDIAKFTGLTGESLKSAVDSSKEFINELRNAGNLTSNAAKNMIEISANAKKFGVESEMQPLLKAMTSSSNLLLESSAETKALLFSAAGSVGKIDDLMNGVIGNSKEGINAMANGLENQLKRFGVSSLEAIDNLSDAAKTKLNISLKATYGINIGQFRSQIQALREAGKGYAERIQDIEKEEKNRLTIEERNTLEEKKRALKTSAFLSVLNVLDEAAKGADNMTQALEKFGGRRKEFEKDLSAMGVAATDNAGMAKGAIENAIGSINQGLKKANKKEIKIDSSEIENALKDPTAMRELNAKLTKAQNELSTAQKGGLDPINDMALYLKNINDYLRDYTQSTFSKVFNSWFGRLLAQVGVISGLLTGALFVFGKGLTYFESLQDMKKMFKKGFHPNEPEVSKKGLERASSTKSSLGEKVKGGIDKVSKKAKDGYEATTKGAKSFYKKINDPFKKATQEMGDSLVAKTKDWSTKISGFTNKLSTEMKNNPLKTFGKIWQSSWESVWEITKFGMSKVGSVVKSGWSLTWTAMRSGVTSIANGVKAIPYLIGQVPGIVRGLFTGIGRGVKAAPGIGRALAGGLTKGLGGGLALATRGLGVVGRGLLSLTGPVNGAIAVVFGLMDAFSAADRAGETFGKKVEDLTLNEEYAAKSAGLFVGVLNGLLLGLPGLILPLDKITDAIAVFNAKVPIMTLVLAPVMVALEAVWGAIKGVGLMIWEIFKGIGGMIKNIFYPVFEGLSDIFSTIGKMFSGFSGKADGFTKALRSMGGVVGIVSGAIKSIGVGIGWIFKAIGSVIGFVLKSVLKIIEGFTVVFEPIITVIAEIGSGITEVFDGVWEVMKGIGDIVYEIFSPIMKLFSSTSSDGTQFFDVMKKIGWVFGKVIGVAIKVILQPFMLLARVLSGIGKIIKAVVSVFRGDFSKAGGLVKEAFAGVWEAILYPFTSVIKIITGLWNSFWSPIAGDFKWLKTQWDALWKWIGDGIKWIQNKWNEFVGWIGDGLKWLKTKWDEMIGWIGDGFKWIKSLWDDFWDFIGSGIAGVKVLWNGMWDSIGSGIAGVKSLWDGLWDSIGSGLGTVKSLWNGFWDYITPGFLKSSPKAKAEAPNGKSPIEKKLIPPTGKVVNGESPLGSQWSPVSPTGKASLDYKLTSPTGAAKIAKATEGKSINLAEKSFIPSNTTNKTTEIAKNDFTNAPIKPTVKTSSGQGNIHTAVASSKASSDPVRTEVTSPELGKIAAENIEQNEHLVMLVEQMKLLNEKLTPKSQSIVSGGGVPGSTLPNEVMHEPAKYYRSPTSAIAKTAGKAILNVGANNI